MSCEDPGSRRDRFDVVNVNTLYMSIVHEEKDNRAQETLGR